MPTRSRSKSRKTKKMASPPSKKQNTYYVSIKGEDSYYTTTDYLITAKSETEAKKLALAEYALEEVDDGLPEEVIEKFIKEALKQNDGKKSVFGNKKDQMKYGKAKIDGHKFYFEHMSVEKIDLKKKIIRLD